MDKTWLKEWLLTGVGIVIFLVTHATWGFTDSIGLPYIMFVLPTILLAWVVVCIILKQPTSMSIVVLLLLACVLFGLYGYSTLHESEAGKSLARYAATLGICAVTIGGAGYLWYGVKTSRPLFTSSLAYLSTTLAVAYAAANYGLLGRRSYMVIIIGITTSCAVIGLHTYDEHRKQHASS